MDKIARFELSPGSIRFDECTQCGADTYSFLTVALNSDGVHDIGRITKCEGCEDEP